MRLTTGTIASFVLTIGALMLLIAGASSESASGLRKRKLYNYSRNDGSSYSYSGQYAQGNYDAAAAANDGTDDYNDASYNSYSSSSYYNGQANGNSYNGRDQQWGGQNVQWNYDDDEYEPEVIYEEYDEDKFMVVGKFGGLSGMETMAIIGLVLFLSVSCCALIMLKHGFNVVHLFQVYCFRGVFGHTDQKTSGTEPETVEGGFVKLDEA